MACAPSFLGARAMLMSAHDGGVDHHVLVVVVVGQELENPLENAALGPSVEALVDDLPVAEALGQITPRNTGSKPEKNSFDEQPIVRRRAAHMAFAARQNVFDPIPLVVAQGISSHRSAPPKGRPLTSQTFADSGIPSPIQNTKRSASDSNPFSNQMKTGPSAGRALPGGVAVERRLAVRVRGAPRCRSEKALKGRMAEWFKAAVLKFGCLDIFASLVVLVSS